MEKEMDELSELWKKGKATLSGEVLHTEKIIAEAEGKKRGSLSAHYVNIAIMLGMAVVIAMFYFVFYPMQTALSNAGIITMIGVLVVRSVIEVVSLLRSRTVRIAETTVRAAEDSMAFYQFRKRMHGTVTITLVVLYILGFFMLSPEYARHISILWLIVLYGGFSVIAAVLIIVIRKGLRQEIEDLRKMVELQRQLMG